MIKAASQAGLAAMIALLATTGVQANERGYEDPKLTHEKYVLDNGLEVILHRDNRVPLVAVNVWYHVGSGDETPGKSGFAHLFEHMLFQGSQNVGEDRHFAILKDIGASGVNGTTNPDRTNYFEVVPSHQVETALWLESDRMGYLLPLLTQKSLDNQIEVVRNERRQRYDNVPYGKTRFARAAAIYPEGHPYRYLTIGKHEDLTSSTLADVTEFYKKWYVPSNATLVVAGDFETAEMKKLIDKWFGGLPKLAKPERVPAPVPTIAETERVQLQDPFAKLRRIEYVWVSPRLYGEGDAELDLASHTLAASGVGRLYEILVHDKQWAQSVWASQGSSQWTSEFSITVTLKSDADLAKVDQVVKEQVAKMIAEAPTQAEFDRAVVSMEKRFIWNLEDLMARANTLQSYNHFLGKPDAITWDLDRWRKSTPAKVHEWAKKVLLAPHVEIVTNPAPATATRTGGPK